MAALIARARTAGFTLAAVFVAIAVASPPDLASAHTRSRSFSSWRVSADAGTPACGEIEVDALFTVRAFEATRLPRTPGRRGDLGETLAAHVGERLRVRRGGTECAPAHAPRILAAREGYLRLELRFACLGMLSTDAADTRAAHAEITVENGAFFDLAPSHVHIARVRGGGHAAGAGAGAGADTFERVLTASARSFVVAGRGARASAGSVATLAAYVRLGVEHILAGLDHLAFLLGLLLLCRRPRDVVLLVTGFTIGHSLTLALAVLGALQPDESLVEALIGFTIALVAVENVAVGTGRAAAFAAAGALALTALLAVRLAAGLGPPAATLAGLAMFTGCYLTLADSRATSARMRPALTVLFGLVHGFGFAGVLQEIGLPPGRAAAALLGFNVGVELGQLAVVAALAGAAALLGRWLRSPDAFVDTTSAALAGLGLFWFFARAYA